MLDPITLQNPLVRLVPLALDHVDGLGAALADGDLPELFFTSTSVPGGASQLVEEALRDQVAGWRQPFVVEDAATGAVIGSTSLYDPVPAVPRIAIGYTWYTGSRQRSGVNVACKQLLLRHAFTTLGCATVQFHTDRFNLASQHAIERLGATREGVLRHHQRRTDGSLRDTVCYSILADEWPDVSAWLEIRARRRS